jgi:hypothetical protein
MLSFKEFFLQEKLENPLHRRDSALWKGNSINKKTGKLSKAGIIANRHKPTDANFKKYDKVETGLITPSKAKQLMGNKPLRSNELKNGKHMGRSNVILKSLPNGNFVVTKKEN